MCAPSCSRSILRSSCSFVVDLATRRRASLSVVSINGEQKTVKTKDTHPVNPASQDGVNDNTELMHLHEAGLLHNLECRYKADKIYTYTGNILIAVNPFQKLPIYGEDILMDYIGKSIGVMPPHVYAIADLALRKMKTSGVGQAIIISGESGAGKTETAKVALEYLTSLSGAENEGDSLATKYVRPLACCALAQGVRS